MSPIRKYLSGHDKRKKKKLKNLLGLKEERSIDLLSKNREIHHLKMWLMKKKKENNCNELHEGLPLKMM